MISSARTGPATSRRIVLRAAVAVLTSLAGMALTTLSGGAQAQASTSTPFTLPVAGSVAWGSWDVGAVDENGDPVSVAIYQSMGGNFTPSLVGTVGSQTWAFAPGGTLGINTPIANDVFTYAQPNCPLQEPVWTTDIGLPPANNQLPCWSESMDPALGAGPSGVTAPLTATGPNGEALVFDHWQASGVTSGPCYTGSAGLVPVLTYPLGYMEIGTGAPPEGAGVMSRAAVLGTWYDPAAGSPPTVTAAAVYAPASPDTTPPIISMTAPNGCDAGTDKTGTVTHYPLDSVVRASYDCVDPGNGPATTCDGTVPDGSPIDTSTLGTHSFTVTSTDAAGNTSTVTKNYTVVLVACDPGSYSATGYGPCQPAPAGTYVSTSGATSATPCQPGTYQPNSGTRSCLTADPGYYVSGSGATSETLCGPGTYSTGGSSSCTDAPAGFYATGYGSTTWTGVCYPGTYSAAGSASCTDAQPGYYAYGPYQIDGVSTDPSGVTNGFGAASETPCPDGTWSDPGASSQYQCFTVDAPTVSATIPYLVAVGQTLDVSGTATQDHQLGLTYSWDFGDGTTDTNAGLTDSHSFTSSGIYNVCLTATVTVTPDVMASSCTQVVVYDPSGGFVTGAGWINSPAGAYVSYPDMEGTARFAFVSKYAKGATVPSGTTQFQFQTAGLTFSSTDYQWLLVNKAGTNAQFKGTGTFNGLPGYEFMIWTTDGSPDTFRIQITDASGITVYDNGSQQPIGAGNIIVHS